MWNGNYSNGLTVTIVPSTVLPRSGSKRGVRMASRILSKKKRTDSTTLPVSISHVYSHFSSPVSRRYISQLFSATGLPPQYREEAFDACFEKSLRDIPKYDPKKYDHSINGFLIGVWRNAMREFARSTRRKIRTDTSYAAMHSLAKSASRRENPQIAELRESIQRLPPIEREMVLLFYADMDMGTIARRLRKSKSYVSRKIGTIRLKLKEMMSQDS